LPVLGLIQISIAQPPLPNPLGRVVANFTQPAIQVSRARSPLKIDLKVQDHGDAFSESVKLTLQNWLLILFSRCGKNKVYE
jgi:hypothetical protein